MRLGWYHLLLSVSYTRVCYLDDTHGSLVSDPTIGIAGGASSSLEVNSDVTATSDEEETCCVMMGVSLSPHLGAIEGSM